MLNCFKEGLKVACAEALVVSSLDDLNKEGWAVLHGLCEDLQEITLLIVIDEDFLVLDDVDVLLHLQVNLAKALSQVVVVGVRDLIKE